MHHAARLRIALLVVSLLAPAPLLAQVGGQDPHAEFLSLKMKEIGRAHV